MFRAQIPLTKEKIKEINSVIFKFPKRGRDKVKRLSLVSDYKDGGLRMPNFTLNVLQSWKYANRNKSLRRLTSLTWSNNME